MVLSFLIENGTSAVCALLRCVPRVRVRTFEPGGGRDALLDQAMTAFLSMGGTFTWPLLIVHRGHASLMAGELDEAQTFAERALALTRDRDQSGYVVSRADFAIDR